MTSATLAAARPSLAQLLLPYWVSKDRYWAWGLLATCLSISFGGIYVSLLATEVVAKTTDALVARDWPTLWSTLIFGFVLGLLMAGLAIVSYAAQEYLQLRWRAWLSHRLIDRWTANQRFYPVERDGLVTNSDQRISEDINIFVQRSLLLTLGVITVPVSAVTFGGVLWGLSGVLSLELGGHTFEIPGYLLYAAIIYSLLGLLIAHWVGKPLIALNIRKQTVEADFRALGMNLRENAEQIAFYRGGPREGHRMMQQFRQVQLNFIALLIRICKSSVANSAYLQVGSLVPTALSMPRYLSGAVSLGGLTQVTAAFNQVSSSLNFFSSSYVDFSIWLASANRLRDLQGALLSLETQVPGITLRFTDKPVIAASALTLTSPLGETLSHTPAVYIEQGQKWVVRGPSGAGKSTLMRALSGLWPHGSGWVQVPDSSVSQLFVPQKSYIPQGTLKAALCYPDGDSRFDDDQCRQALIDVRLEARVESLTQAADWQNLLSGGEQQRLAIARVLLQQPKLVFFDEATSGLDPDTERYIYQLLFARLSESAIISISHNRELDPLFSHTLDITPAHDIGPAADATTHMSVRP
ncbi:MULTISPECIES: ABC transporter ATP-binding protein/permease [Pseudomonas]|uniref:ABC transporter ATP-binding protein/permease n=1 Tax=Pseudomonas pergaminensis TaxID=2853159 RepID=A0ABD7TPV9_9PSED|nr:MULTISPECIES: ABC transporter ATP-binding protein/permease [Pseudomonas]USW03804.1 ABC transporter ATP-binding protein/permease [Pseudomonas pergaminensis]